MTKNIRDNMLFDGIDPGYVDEFLASLPEPVKLAKGQFLWRQDDPGHSMYLLISGKLEALIHYKKGEEKSIATIGAGAVIGEVCVFGEKKRSASIRAVEDSELLLVEGDMFLQKVRNKEVGVLQMCYNVSKLLTQRLIMANSFIVKIQALADEAVDKATVKSELAHYRERFFQESLFN